MSVKIGQNIAYAKKIMFENYFCPSTYACSINRYLESTVDDLVITCDETINVSGALPINLNNK